jgi:23S rRNA pseudouridine1911/1915/1917 synthase
MIRLEIAIMEKYKYSRSKTLYLIKNGHVFVNGNIVLDRCKMVDGKSEIIIKIPTLSATILWKNENLAVIHKPHGMVVEQCPTTSFAHSVLENIVSITLNLPQVFPLHRLDKDTEGIILVALNKKSYEYYSSLMRDRKFTKSYKAFYVNTHFKLQDFHHFICIHGKSIWSYESTCLCQQNDHQVITIKIKETIEGPQISNNGDKVCETLMKPITNGYNCILVTGRTHQIRLTMKSIKQVISGDQLYGSREKCPLQLFSYYIDIDKDLII